MRLSTVILPIYRWSEGREVWRRAEELGFHAAYTYDHLSWRSFREGPWFGAVPTLTAAAGVTRGMRLGTLVSSPNFREPVTLAKEVISLDDISDGRIVLGIGAGATGFDATVLGQRAWSPKERIERFEEFLPLLDRLLTRAATTESGTFYSAVEARNIPGCVQRPRVPFLVAGTGPRGMRLAARYGQGWVSTGDPVTNESGTPEQSLAAIGGQVERLTATLEKAGREPKDLTRVLLTGFTPGCATALSSVAAFTDFAGRHAEAGIDEIVVHWPVPNSVFDTDPAVFERIATEARQQLA